MLELPACLVTAEIKFKEVITMPTLRNLLEKLVSKIYSECNYRWRFATHGFAMLRKSGGFIALRSVESIRSLNLVACSEDRATSLELTT